MTETYLNLQDSLYQVWNLLLKQEQNKIEAMETVVNQLILVQHGDEKFGHLPNRVNQLERIRYNQKTITNPHVVEEFDKASYSLFSEILKSLDSLEAGQTWKSELNLAHHQLTRYRELYNALAIQYNQFVDQHKKVLKELDDSASLQRKPVFKLSDVQ